MKLSLVLFLLQILSSPLLILLSGDSSSPSPFPSDFLFGPASPASQEDIELLHSLGVNRYRISVSWARILPEGKFGDVNLAGIEYYNNLIDALVEKGIEPFVTLSHYDFPQQLEEIYQSWLNPQMQKAFRYYADVCFEAFGDRVKYWVTFNDPHILVMQDYRSGVYPTCHCSKPYGNCIHRDSETESFLAAHNIILSHAAVVDTYRAKYQKTQKGSIGIVMNAIWFEPYSNSSADKLAVQRAQSFCMNWFLDPIVLGKYPTEMQELLGSNLPEFSYNELSKIQKSVDFIGINHYTSLYAKDCSSSRCKLRLGCSRTEGFTLQIGEKDGIPIGEPTGMNYYYVCPQGMEKIVTYVKERYNNIPMFITENGMVNRTTQMPPLNIF